LLSGVFWLFFRGQVRWLIFWSRIVVASVGRVGDDVDVAGAGLTARIDVGADGVGVVDGAVASGSSLSS